MLKAGNAYADETEHETMRDERMNGVASQRSNASTEDSLADCEERKAVSEDGIMWCIRAKIRADSLNKTIPDIVIYRCDPTRYHHTDAKWKVYPT